MKIKSPSNMYMMWNMGSNIGMTMTTQISVGFILSMNYFFHSNNMFKSSFNIYFNINYGWLLRFMHSNLTSLIFMMMMIHMTRSMMYKNLFKMKMWMSGITMYVLTMMISFMGYSLIWNQMSYWAMMVITNFISSVPMIGEQLMKMIWGNFFINNILINRFFSIHFITPMMMTMIMILHLNLLHQNKSSSPMGMNSKIDQMILWPNHIIKDLTMWMTIMMMMMMMNMNKPEFLNNPDNFNMMNYFKTPNHIEPEWYFLMFYSVLRSIENKLSGLTMMIMFMMMWILMPLFMKHKFQSNKFIFMNKITISMMLMSTLIMSWTGTKMTEYPYTQINFMLMMMMMKSIMMMKMLSNKSMKK